MRSAVPDWRTPLLWVAAWALVPIVSLAWSSAPWLGDALWGQEIVGRTQTLTLSLVAVTCALTGVADSSTWLSVFGSGVERRRHVLSRCSQILCSALAAYGLVHVVVAAASAAAPLTVTSASGWPWLTQASIAASVGVVGYCVGSVAGRSWAAIVFGALVPVLVLAASDGAAPSSLAEFAQSGSLIGYAPLASVFAQRAVWALALAASVTWVLVSGRGRVALLVPAAVFLIGYAVPAGADGYAKTDTANSYCVGENVRLCGPTALKERIDDTSPLVQRAAVELQALGVQAHTPLFAWTAQNDIDQLATVLIIDPGNIRAPYSPQMVVNGVVSPKSCLVWRDANTVPPDAWATADLLLTQYVSKRLGLDASTANLDEFAKTVDAPTLLQVMRDSATALTGCETSALPPFSS